MTLTTLDWAIIVFFIGLTLFIGVYFSKRASKSITDFFLGGRKLPWYVAGVSMVATTFAADTPLAVTEIVAKNGIAGNWVWWNMMIGGLLTTFLFARLWRRANILTEVEFINIRYSGKPSRFLRLFKSVYLGLIMNVAIIAWVNLAFVSILEVFFDLSHADAILYTFGVCLLIGLYTTLSGLWGVAVNDMFQFVLAMTGSIALAIFVLNSDKIGGIDGLKASLPESSFSFFPTIGEQSVTSLSVGIASFFAFIGFQWWASWYPGNEPGGGGYIAQRMMSAKTEKDSLLATLFFQFGHYCLRPWPWIIVALAAMVLYPELGENDKKLGYVMAMKEFLPDGWRGLMLAAFGAAYMSTISTQLNWGAGYLTNDLFMPLRRRNNVANRQNTSNEGENEKDQKYLVRVSRIMTVALVFVGCFTTFYIDTISGVWAFIIECGAGLGLVLILRWYWWRINAWSEITATIAPFVAYSLCKFVFVRFDEAWGYDLFTDPRTFFFTVAFTTISWLAVTFLTKPEPQKHLLAFYHRVKPGGNWKIISGEKPISVINEIGLWLSAVVLIYSALFFTGNLILGFNESLLLNGILLLISGIVFALLFKRYKLG
ncbi:MAG: Na+:solute symporter [Bacteroidia bacterium]